MKIVIIVVSGRKSYMNILIPQIMNQKEHFNEIRLWDNTYNYDDKMNLWELKNKYPEIQIINKPNGRYSNMGSTIDLFTNNILENNTLYIKFDDDIVYIEPLFIKKMKEFRLANPEPPVIYANTVNNGICAHYQQKNKNEILNVNYPTFENKADNLLWLSNKYAYMVQHDFKISKLQGKLNKWYIDNVTVKGRFSINAISWTNDSIPNMKDITGIDEQWLTVDLPDILGKDNLLYGGVICQHFAYFPQRVFNNNFYLDDKLHELI